ncbi:MAG: putative phage abortive infection protein [Bacteroidota bacterium]
MNDKNDEEDIGKKFPYSAIVFAGLALTVIGFIILYNRFSILSSYVILKGNESNALAMGQFQSYFIAIAASLFSLVGIIFLILTFKKQSDSFRRERFENQFFEMMKIYRENVSEMDYVAPDSLDEMSPTYGRKVFVKINREFLTLAKDLHIRFPDIIERDLTSITYLIIFFGVANEGDEMLMLSLRKHLYINRYPQVENYIKTLSNQRTIYNRKVKKFGGHQIRLGHYFRHLYQTVLFVHSQEFLTQNEKYDYIKLLRGQMSTHEQAVFFYNSLSPLGSKWELRFRNALTYELARDMNNNEMYRNNKPISKSDFLITEYRLIQNIPEGFTDPINPRIFYNILEFEEDDQF